jgi:N-formylglutamate amidohydrolase
MCFAGPVLARAAEVPSTNLVFFQHGDVPIILTAPHGGNLSLRDVAERDNGITVRDAGTYELTLLVNEELIKLLKGKKPYVVAAQFHREFIDANRMAGEAYESPGAKPIYEAYHQHIRESVAEIRQNFGGEGLLIDIHGQGRDTTSIFRGTANGVTVRHLIEKQGEDSFTGADSVLGLLAIDGYVIVPANTPPGLPAEDRDYNGGFTVRTYGSNHKKGIDAIQLELGGRLRNADRKSFAKDLAQAIFTFQEKYMKLKVD